MLFDIIFVNYLLMSFLIFVINMKSLAIFSSIFSSLWFTKYIQNTNQSKTTSRKDRIR